MYQEGANVNPHAWKSSTIASCVQLLYDTARLACLFVVLVASVSVITNRVATYFHALCGVVLQIFIDCKLCTNKERKQCIEKFNLLPIYCRVNRSRMSKSKHAAETEPG